MKSYNKIFLLLLLITLKCFSQNNPGARHVSLAFSDISSCGDPFALFNNPSELSKINKREIGLYYSPAPFGVKELSSAYGSYVEPTSYGSLSGGFMIYGFELYKETQVVIGYGRTINNNFSVGITSVYKNISIKNYGNKGFLIFNLGATAEITKNINIGFVLENVTRTSIENEANQIPVVFSLGSSVKVIEELKLFAALNKELNFTPSVRFGAEYKLLNFLLLRLGAANEPQLFAGGLGIIYNFVQVDYAFTSHPDLGLTHQFGLIIRFE